MELVVYLIFCQGQIPEVEIHDDSHMDEHEKNKVYVLDYYFKLIIIDRDKISF